MVKAIYIKDIEVTGTGYGRGYWENYLEDEENDECEPDSSEELSLQVPISMVSLTYIN
jgi:hypothetical protein